MTSILKTSSVTPWKKKEKKKKSHQFFWQDKTGRGITNSFNQTEVKKNFIGERSWDGEAAYAYALRADIGDVWENETNKITRIS